MNVTGFRKALKKFEKATRVHCLEMYTDERISSEAFAKGETIEAWLKAAEDMFSTHFEHGDIKKARDRLRKQDSGHTVSLSAQVILNVIRLTSSTTLRCSGLVLWSVLACLSLSSLW